MKIVYYFIISKHIKQTCIDVLLLIYYNIKECKNYCNICRNLFRNYLGGNMNIYVSASILGADLANLSSEIKKVEKSGIDMIHFDVMDGVFVPNISFGIPVLNCIKKCTTLLFDVHLMIIDPIKYIKSFAEAGAGIITFHAESESDISKTINLIHSYGIKAGISIKPNTSIDTIIPYLEKLDMVLIMTVEPGFGGQGFIESTLGKISALREIITERNLSVDIQVDGGINDNSAEIVKKAGANNLVSGSYLFNAKDTKQAVGLLKK